MAGEDDLPTGDNDVFDPDKTEVVEEAQPEPLFRVYKGSKIAVSRAVGTLWKKRYDAAIAAYELIFKAWDETFMYYNNNQTGELRTPRGLFKRGDSTENIVYSNLNVMLPAIYSQDPDIAVNTIDEDDADLAGVLKSLINVLIRGKYHLNAKPKIRRMIGFSLLANFGILKLDWTKKDDSSEMAMQNLQELSRKLVEAKDMVEAEEIYGEIEALEAQMEVFEKSGPKLGNVLPQNLIVDPYAEDDDALDSKWMIERIYFKTAALIAQYTEPCEDEDEEGGKTRNYVYKPTHKASFTSSNGTRDDGLGMVLDALGTSDAINAVSKHEDDARAAYRNLYYTECFLVWDKALRRVMLYHRDDWTWPLWVWDDPLQISRFYPYFISSFGMSTGGVVSVGETAYYLDQQDEVNDINRQVSKIRRTIFDYFYYNSDKVDQKEAEKFVDAIRGKGQSDVKLLGVRAGEGKLGDFIQAFVPPSMDQQLAPLFNKDTIMASINRISNTSDALRGTQFKTNTNEAAVQSYQDAARMAVGAKTDSVEDTVSDLTQALAELCVQNYTTEDVAKLIGQKQAQKWQQMPIEEFRSNYQIECVAGTMEKPNSLFKKKEAVQIAQSIGQFASKAPMTAFKIMLRVLQNAFSEVVIKPEDWDSLEQEATASMQQGNNAPGGGATAPGGAGNAGGGDVQSQLMALPQATKAKVVQMQQQGVPSEQIKQFLLAQIGTPQGAPASQQPQSAQPVAQ